MESNQDLLKTTKILYIYIQDYEIFEKKIPW